jgi:hypothetical protein
MEVVEAVAEAVAEAEVKPIEVKVDPVPDEKPAKVLKRSKGGRR